MAVRFILGRAGTGKTHFCFERILQAIRDKPLGPAIYWIVPRQATFITERQLACAGGLGGYFRAEFSTFRISPPKSSLSAAAPRCRKSPIAAGG